MRRAIVSVAIGVAAWPAAVQAQDLPAWMAGCWDMRDGERWAEECWTAPRAGQMLGSGRAGTGETLGSFEFMRIEQDDGGLTFSAAPGGTGWTAFASAEDAGEGVTFVNPDNEYPQRIRYWREGDRLKARISRLDGSSAQEWSFAPLAGE